MRVYVHSPSPYFIVKKWLAGSFVLLEKNPLEILLYSGYDQRK